MTQRVGRHDLRQRRSVSFGVLRLQTPEDGCVALRAPWHPLRVREEKPLIPVDALAPFPSRTLQDAQQRAVDVIAHVDDPDAALRLRSRDIPATFAIEELVVDAYAQPLLILSVNDQSNTLSENEYLNLVRKKYWRGLFDSPIITGKLTSKLAAKYQQMVDRMAAYDFSRYNIKQILISMNAELAKGIQECIMVLFEEMTSKFTYYPEMERNIHYFNGWCTNKAHKINSKIILPVNGIFSSWSRDLFDLHRAVSVVSDIEKVFDYFDGDMTAPVDLQTIMQDALDHGQTKNITCKYFTVTFFKKGTMHIKFSNQELVDRFNIYCAKKKAWLPPRYGRVSYEFLTKDEKAVVDSFHGPNSQEEYTKVVANPSFYLTEAEPFMLLAGQD